MTNLVASSKNITARVNNVIKMLSKLKSDQFRHFIRVMNPEWVSEMASILGTDEEPENLYNAIKALGDKFKIKEDTESEAA